MGDKWVRNKEIWGTRCPRKGSCIRSYDMCGREEKLCFLIDCLGYYIEKQRNLRKSNISNIRSKRIHINPKGLKFLLCRSSWINKGKCMSVDLELVDHQT